ncbi:MAG TPA: flagellar motor protein MotD [Gammaproteobacteria bacterium]|nr:flagellar motor protein MotD [Gammaproteobacteria bacterium]
MARKKRTEEHENHERWLVSYADFITLLFAFFVVMYSISSVNEGKYRVLSDSMVMAFSEPARSMEPVQVGKLLRTPIEQKPSNTVQKPMIELFRPPLPERRIRQQLEKKLREDQEKARLEKERKALEEQARIDARNQELATSLQQSMDELIDAGLINVRRKHRWVEVEIKSSVLFESGSAQLSERSVPVLATLAEKLSGLDARIQVEGFTDNIPISNFEFRSNWELSAARAASVVHLFTRLGVDPRRMVAVGYGEYRPVADNATPEGRARNRRVVLVIRPAMGDVRRQAEAGGLVQDTEEVSP